MHMIDQPLMATDMIHNYSLSNSNNILKISIFLLQMGETAKETSTSSTLFNGRLQPCIAYSAISWPN